MTWSRATVSSSFLEIDLEHMGQTARLQRCEQNGTRFIQGYVRIWRPQISCETFDMYCVTASDSRVERHTRVERQGKRTVVSTLAG
jgi:hypothetical protein